MRREAYDCVVVGRGLIGTAAAKYLKQSFDKVAVIGPGAPDETNIATAKVFASHYDQSRVQRVIGVDPIWTALNKQSAEAYPAIEKESGISFHGDEGCLYVSPYGIDKYLQEAGAQSKRFNIKYKSLENAAAIQVAVDEYSFPTASAGLLEDSPSGHINPFKLIEAQEHVFVKNGGTTINETVIGIKREPDGYKVQTNAGTTLNSNRVLVSAGAFSNFNTLILRPLQLELESETVLLAQVSEEEASRLQHLPSLLYEIDEPEIEGIYLVRPLPYPDGNYYLKMGSNLPSDIRFHSLEAIQEWFRTGNSEANIGVLKKFLHQIIPNLKVLGYNTKRCIVSRTIHRKAYIGSVDGNNLFVACGGNGYSAMCSDALGRLATSVVTTGTVPPPFELHSFEPIFE